MRRLLSIIICIGLLPLSAIASVRLDSIVARGNRAYQLGQRDVILQCANELRRLIPIECQSAADEGDYRRSMLKLYGNYHYTNAAIAPESADSAEAYYLKAKEIDSGRLSTGHLLDLEMAQLYYLTERYKDALQAMDLALDYIDRQGNLEKGDTEWNNYAMQRAMCLARTGQLSRAIAAADSTMKLYSDKASLDYARAQRMNAKILTLASRRPADAVRAYKTYFATQKKYVERNFASMDAKQREQYWLMVRPFVADCYSLEGLDAAFLYDVALFAKGLLLHVSSIVGDGHASQESLAALGYTWRDVRQALKPGQAAVEFIQYEKDGNDHMAALVLRHNTAPKFVKIANPEEFSAMAGENLTTTDRRGKDRLYADKALSASVITPLLQSVLRGVERVYFAPDGYLHRYAVEYSLAAEGIDMYRLSSTRRLVEGSGKGNIGGALLIGGIDYNYRKGQPEAAENDSAAYALYRSASFARLDPMSNEARSLYSLRANVADSLLLSSMATEEAFRRLAPQFDNILVATHGDFSSEAADRGTDLKPTLADDAMSQNIVAFAGVNASLRDKDFDPKAQCDGLLSALELSTLDLSKCHLFTLSACQTALGQISADGVFGLQRGLKNAGVGAMLLSLWNVNSRATNALMTEFYRNMSRGLSLHKAFFEARKKLMTADDNEAASELRFDPAVMASRNVTAAKENFNAPQFTDAFILIDALD